MRAPARSAMDWEPSVEPLSAMMISPWMLADSKARWALRMQVSRVSASLRQGMTTESSGASGGASGVTVLGTVWNWVTATAELTWGGFGCQREGREWPQMKTDERR